MQVVAERHEVAFIIGAIVGSVAGATYGLLNAPQAGWRTRADLAAYAEEAGDRLARRVATVIQEARQLIGGDLAEPERNDAGAGTTGRSSSPIESMPDGLPQRPEGNTA